MTIPTTQNAVVSGHDASGQTNIGMRYQGMAITAEYVPHPRACCHVRTLSPACPHAHTPANPELA